MLLFPLLFFFLVGLCCIAQAILKLWSHMISSPPTCMCSMLALQCNPTLFLFKYYIGLILFIHPSIIITIFIYFHHASFNPFFSFLLSLLSICITIIRCTFLYSNEKINYFLCISRWDVKSNNWTTALMMVTLNTYLTFSFFYLFLSPWISLWFPYRD